MIWLAVFPTLTTLHLILGRWLRTLAPVQRSLVLVTIAVPIVVYGLVPQLLRVRRRLLTRLPSSSSRQTAGAPRSGRPTSPAMSATGAGKPLRTGGEAAEGIAPNCTSLTPPLGGLQPGSPDPVPPGCQDA